MTHTWIKKLIIYLIGTVLLVDSIGLFTHSILSGALMLCAAVLIFPQSRTILEQHTVWSFTPLRTTGVVAILFFGSSLSLLWTIGPTTATNAVPFLGT